MRLLLGALFLGLISSPVSAANLFFCWNGGNGYTMTGKMQVRDGLMSNAILTERDVSGFSITGYFKGETIGDWNMNDRRSDTTWHLRFDPVGLRFLTGGSFAGTNSQGWNADGNVTDCGENGFGFNSGNFAQDICVDGQFIADSSIPPETELFVGFLPVSPDCRGALPTSKRK